jgi:glucosylceramidase
MNKYPLLFLLVSGSMLWAQQKPFTTNGKKATVYTTAKETNKRLSPEANTVGFTDLVQPLETQISVFVDPNKTFQTVMGFGGAITDASAETFAKMPKDKQQEILTAYYDAGKGIGYTMARTNIHSCDFSSDSYTYVKEGDKELKSFSVDHDKKYRIPLIKKAIATAGGNLTLFASPWSPPAFMKDSNTMLKGGKLKPEFYQSWATYYTKFIKAYEKEGIPVWGISVQNEPMATQTWESCIFTGEEERDFIKNFLGPTMHKEGFKDKKIIAWDHNRDMMFQRASAVLNDPESAKYVWGIGYHWYETWNGGAQMFDNLKLVHETFPNTNLIFTEGCKEQFKYDNLNDWKLGELYGNNLINDFNSGTTAWTEWNILLDETGGPNHVGNFCYAPIIGNTKTGEVIYTNEYYYIGHFSKFVRPGAKRLACSASRSAVQAAAFLNTDGKVAVIVMNKGEEKLTYNIWIEGKALAIESLPHSIQTVVF